MRPREIRTGTPVPRYATLDIPSGAYAVYFDRLLTADVLNPLSWYIDKTTNRYAASSAVASGVTVAGLMSLYAPGAGPDYAHYDAIPPDLLGYDGSPVAAFHTCPLR